MIKHSYDLNHPLYGSQFIAEDLLLVVGGGGEQSEKPNRLSAIKIDIENPKPLRRYREIKLPDQDDYPVSIDASLESGNILVGMNQNSSAIDSGINNHLRRFVYRHDHLISKQTIQLSPRAAINNYQKLTRISENGHTAAIAMSFDKPPAIYIVEASTLALVHKVETNAEPKDVALSPDGKILCFVTNSKLEAVSTITGRSLLTQDKFNGDSLCKVEFVSDSQVAIGGSCKSGIALTQYDISVNKMIRRKVVSTKCNNITSMCFRNGLIAVSGNDFSVIVIKSKTLGVIKVFKKLHQSSITSVKFSPSGRFLASACNDGTLCVIKLPDNLKFSRNFFQKVFATAISAFTVLALAVLVQWLVKRRVLDGILEVVKNQSHDSSSYFKVEPMEDYDVSNFLTTTPSVSASLSSQQVTEFVEPASSETTFSITSFESAPPSQPDLSITSFESASPSTPDLSITSSTAASPSLSEKASSASSQTLHETASSTAFSEIPASSGVTHYATDVLEEPSVADIKSNVQTSEKAAVSSNDFESSSNTPRTTIPETVEEQKAKVGPSHQSASNIQEPSPIEESTPLIIKETSSETPSTSTSDDSLLKTSVPISKFSSVEDSIHTKGSSSAQQVVSLPELPLNETTSVVAFSSMKSNPSKLSSESATSTASSATPHTFEEPESIQTSETVQQQTATSAIKTSISTFSVWGPTPMTFSHLSPSKIMNLPVAPTLIEFDDPEQEGDVAH